MSNLWVKDVCKLIRSKIKLLDNWWAAYGKCLSSYLLFIATPALRQFLPWSFRIFNADSLDCPTSDSAAAPTLLLLHLHRLFAAVIFPPSFEQHLSLMSKTSTCRLLTSVPQQIVPDHRFLHMPLQLPLSPLLSPNLSQPQPCITTLLSDPVSLQPLAILYKML